jgi:hypothetical protein
MAALMVFSETPYSLAKPSKEGRVASSIHSPWLIRVRKDMPIRKYKGIPSDGLFLSAVVVLVFIKISQRNGYCALIKR